MKKIFILFFVLIGFVSCDPPYMFPGFYDLPKHYFSFSPEKSVYNVGDTMQIKIIIPKKYIRYEGGPEHDITEITESFYEKLTFRLKKNTENNVNLLLDNISVEEGELNFVFDNNRQEYLMKEKVSLVFLKEGELDWNSFFDYNSWISTFETKSKQNSLFLKLYKEDKTFKVEP